MLQLSVSEEALANVNKKIKILGVVVLATAVVLAAVSYFHAHPMVVLAPAGQIADKERNLIVFALALSLVVVLPVFALLFGIAWKYREGNKKAKYSPELDGNRMAELVWWLIPGILILILSVVTWNSSHDLDPFKRLVSAKKPVQIQVVSLDWKWLFIYPEQHIASVNFVELPVDTPIDFSITSDTVMNSFWIPQLAGQIYSMPGMSTQLHILADKPGNYNGSSANISGRGFSGMTFTARAASDKDFASWVQQAKSADQPLNTDTYTELAKPSEHNPVTLYRSAQVGLYDDILMKYMDPSHMHGMGM